MTSRDAALAAEAFSRYTEEWVRRHDRWQVVARHASHPPAKSFVEPAT
ncbi:MAG: hypothetical protein ABI622_08690 [Chloroflexota bacterium]